MRSEQSRAGEKQDKNSLNGTQHKGPNSTRKECTGQADMQKTTSSTSTKTAGKAGTGATGQTKAEAPTYTSLDKNERGARRARTQGVREELG